MELWCGVEWRCEICNSSNQYWHNQNQMPQHKLFIYYDKTNWNKRNYTLGWNNGKTTSLTFRKNLQILYMLFRNQLKDDPLNRLHSKSQSAFTCSKLTIETLEQVVKYVQSYQSRHQNHVIFHIFQTLL